MDISSSSSPWLDYPNHVKNIYPEASSEEDSTSCGAEMRREHMFDKVVTPSDVGKLNRLVIPKQHAEKYFPLDASSTEKGLHLNFEDRAGKSWRFRYSYWNSSQSYVMTKGWSRFVKDKRLDAGDIVSFLRGGSMELKDRLYIDWRRRVNPLALPLPAPTLPPTFLSAHQFGRPFYFRPPLQLPWNHYQDHHHHQNHQQVLLGHCTHQVPNHYSQNLEVKEEEDKKGKKKLKRLRLFGVNMDCEHESTNPSSSNSSSSKPPSPPSLEFQILN